MNRYIPGKRLLSGLRSIWNLPISLHWTRFKEYIGEWYLIVNTVKVLPCFKYIHWTSGDRCTEITWLYFYWSMYSPKMGQLQYKYLLTEVGDGKIGIELEEILKHNVLIWRLIIYSWILNPKSFGKHRIHLRTNSWWALSKSDLDQVSCQSTRDYRSPCLIQSSRNLFQEEVLMTWYFIN